MNKTRLAVKKVRPPVFFRPFPPASLLETRPSNQRHKIDRKARRKKKESKDAQATEKKQAAEQKQVQEGTPSPVRKRRARFSQLGDLASLDLIYKRALYAAHVSNGICRAQPSDAGPGSSIGSSAAGSPFAVWSQEHQCGSGPTWAKTGLASARVWGIGRRLMGLLATGMVSNLSKRMSDRVDDRYTDSKESFVGVLFFRRGGGAGRGCCSLEICGCRDVSLRGASHFALEHVISTAYLIHARAP